MFGWRSLASTDTSACQPSMLESVLPATLTATATPFQLAAYVVPYTPLPTRCLKTISSSPISHLRDPISHSHASSSRPSAAALIARFARAYECLT